MTFTLGDALTIVTVLGAVIGAAFWLGRCLQRLDSNKVDHSTCSARRKDLRAEVAEDCAVHRAACRESRQ